MVELRGLSIDFPIAGEPPRRLRAVADVSAAFPPGGVSAVLGPSGCGKTSIVNAMAGLLCPSSGEVRIDGKPLLGIRPRTAVIFQDFGLLPWRSVQANAELGLAVAGISAPERRRRVEPILRELGLADFVRFYPDRLSGGMKQRVAIARALATEPDLLLMDEPFSSLDALTREAAQDFLLELRRRRRHTTIVVTHSIEEAAYLAEAVFVMGGRNPGTLVARFDIDENKAERRYATAPDGSLSRQDDYRASPEYLAHCAAIRAALRAAPAERMERT